MINGDSPVLWHRHLKPFKFWCQAVLPLVYDDSLSYYELLCKVVDYLNKTMDDVDQIGQLVNEIATGDADIEEILNEIIQQMISDGTFIEGIAPDLGYLRPEWYGAKADAIVDGNVNYNATDDSDAIQRCINDSIVMRVPVVLSNIYYCNANLMAPNNTRVQGFSNNSAYMPCIRMGGNCSILFTCGHYVGMKDFNVCPLDRNTYAPNKTAFLFNDSNGNLDSLMDGVCVYNVEVGVHAKGKNLDINHCSFSHNKIGIKYDFTTLPNDAQLRGLMVNNCRFHGIGEDSAMNWYENCYGIYVENSYWSNLTVTNCIFDQGATAIKGYATNVLFSGNFIECLKYPAIVWGPGQFTEASLGSIQLFTGNTIKGKYSSHPDYPTPSTLIKVDNCESAVFADNSLFRCKQNCIEIRNCNNITIKGNITSAINTDGSSYVAIYTDNSLNTMIMDNNNVDGREIKLIGNVNSGTRIVKGNIGYKYSTNDSDPGLLNGNQYIVAATSTLGSSIPSNIKERQFYVRRADLKTFLQVVRFTGSYSSSTFTIEDGVMTYAKVTNDDVIHMYQYNLDTGVTTELTGDVHFYLTV